MINPTNIDTTMTLKTTNMTMVIVWTESLALSIRITSNESSSFVILVMMARIGVITLSKTYSSCVPPNVPFVASIALRL